MIITINKTLEAEFLKLSKYYKYCFSTDKRKGAFKEYSYKLNNLPLKIVLDYQKEFIVFQDLNRKETLKNSLLKQEA